LRNIRSSGTTPARRIARAIDVLDEQIERLDALGETLFQQPPFGAGHYARNDVERDQPFLRVGFAVDREGDADAAEQELGLAPAVVENIGRHLVEPARELGIGRAHAVVGTFHLIEGGNHLGPPARGH